MFQQQQMASRARALLRTGHTADATAERSSLLVNVKTVGLVPGDIIKHEN